MTTISSPLATSQSYLPLVNQTQIGRAAGLAMHFPTLAALQSAVTDELANIAASSPVWADRQPMTVATEPTACHRVWRTSLSNANTVFIRSGYEVVLAAGSNTVTQVTGPPSGGNAGDLAIDFTNNIAYLNVSGAWTAQSTAPVPSGAAVVDALTSTDGTKALSANQGSILNAAQTATATTVAGHTTQIGANAAAIAATNTQVASNTVAIANVPQTLTPVNLGTGVVSLSSLNNGNRNNYWSGSADTTLPVVNTGANQGDIIEVSHIGSSGLLSLSNVLTINGYKSSLFAGEIGSIEFTGGAWRSLIVTPFLASIGIGATSVTLTSAANANRHNKYTGTTDQTFPVSTTGAIDGDIIEVACNGATGSFTFSGVSATANYKLQIFPGEIGAIEFSNGAWHSLIPANATAVAAPVAVISGTPIEGQVLTCTPAAGYTGSFQWRKDGTAISGQTASTYTLQTGDATHVFTCLYAGLFITNSITPSAGGDVTPPTITSIVVTGSSPTVFNVTFSEAIQNAMPTGTGGFTISGGTHVITGVTYVDTTHVNLTTSTAVVSGETLTAAYAQPGSNPFKDTAGNLLANFTGMAITDNVTAGISDTFTRANQTGLGTCSDGGTWTVVAGGFNISSNACVLTPPGSTTSRVLRNYTLSDCSTQMDIVTTWNAAGSGGPILLARCDGTVNNFISLTSNYDGSVVISKKVGGTTTVLATSATGRISSGVSATMKLVLSGPNITAYVNGVSVASASDSANQTNTQYGFVLISGASDTVKNWAAT